jgi:hypothetical protein
MKNTHFKALVAFIVIAGAATLSPGCNLEPSVPGSPTYEADVRPIFESRCLRCHGDPALQVATPGDRFDLYECPAVDGSAGLCVSGAKGRAVVIKSRINFAVGVGGHMPPSPAAPLSPYQIDTITKWADEPTPLER